MDRDVSIVIPAYNADETLERTLTSALTQETDYNYEIIVVDDGSEISITLSNQPYLDDNRIKLYSQENKGAASAMNLGCERVESQLIIRLDADDELTPNAVQELTRFMELNSSVIYGYSDGWWIGKLQGWEWEKYSPVDQNKLVNQWEKREFDPDLLLEEMYLGHAMIFRKDSFERVGGYDPKYRAGHDRDFALKMSEIGKIKRIPKKLHKYYFQKSGSLTMKYSGSVREKIDGEIVEAALKRRQK